MKVKKKWKKCIHQIALACLLICSVVQWVPEKVFASTLSLEYYELNEDGTIKIENNNNVHTVSQIQAPGADCRMYTLYRYDNGGHLWSNYIVTSAENVKITAVSDDGSTRSDTITSYMASFSDMAGTKLYIYPYISWSGGCFKFHADSISTLYLTDDILEKYKTFSDCAYDYIMHCYGFNNGGTIFECHSYDGGDSENIDSEKTKGQIDNPIEDADIGCPVITRKITRDLSGVDSGNSGAGGSLHVGETQVGDNIYYDNGGVENGGNGFYTSFTWKNSTTTGFSLNKNKYAQTFLQVRIQNRSVIYSNLKHTKVKRKLDSYGENAMVYDSWAVSKKPLYFNLSSKTFLKKYLPKYYEEINSPVNLTNALFLGNKYAFQFRVICTDDLSVIPGSGVNSKWHCGRWTEVTANCDVLEDDDPYQKTGDIDSNGDFNQKEDDTTTKIDDSSSGQADNMDDFKDSAENGTKKGLDASGFGWDDFTNLINECKQVPGLIKSIFSFLPDWVLVFVAVGFGIWIFVLIKRAIV